MGHKHVLPGFTADAGGVLAPFGSGLGFGLDDGVVHLGVGLGFTEIVSRVGFGDEVGFVL